MCRWTLKNGIWLKNVINDINYKLNDVWLQSVLHIKDLDITFDSRMHFQCWNDILFVFIILVNNILNVHLYSDVLIVMCTARPSDSIQMFITIISKSI